MINGAYEGKNIGGRVESTSGISWYKSRNDKTVMWYVIDVDE